LEVRTDFEKGTEIKLTYAGLTTLWWILYLSS